MGDLSAHFSSKEFVCKCGCGQVHVEPDLITCLEQLRNRVRKPIHILSGYRCWNHNKAVGGTEKSRHLVGMAADIQVPGVEVVMLLNHLEDIEKFMFEGGLGLYKTFVHVDTRRLRGRWGVVNGQMVPIGQAIKEYA